MLLIQLTGLSGAGKTSIAYQTKSILTHSGIPVDVIDGDVFRNTYSTDLGFTKEDRCENIRRMAAYSAANKNNFDVIIIAAINPYNEVRKELERTSAAKTVYIYCPLDELIKRDPKGLYKRALLPGSHEGKIKNLSGINDPYEYPSDPHLTINTHSETLADSTDRLVRFIQERLNFDTTVFVPIVRTVQQPLKDGQECYLEQKLQ
ncbi:MAG: cysC [Segetibacter sp.]|nr:cysC [Segetibacter sp.]